jgi:hypothetical protein
MRLAGNYTGRRWPAARIIGTGGWSWRGGARGFPPVQAPILVFSATGKGRAWKPSCLAPWVSFSLLGEQPSQTQVLAFLQAYGDPWGALPGPGDTRSWGALASVLRHAWQAWAEPDDNRICRFLPDRAAEARRFLEVDPVVSGPLLDQLRITPVAGTLAITAKMLGSYMLLDAADMLERQVPVRGCEYCDEPMRMTRAGVRYCSRSCSNMSAGRRDPASPQRQQRST